MEGISSLKSEGVISNKTAKLVRSGASIIAKRVPPETKTVTEIKEPLLAVIKFIEFQRIKLVKPNKKNRGRKISFVPQCIKIPSSQPICI